MSAFHLVIEPPSGGRYEHRLALGSYVLGREQGTCDVAIVSPEISRRHVRLTLSETQCTVEDLGSTSGTYHSGQSVRESRALLYPLELHLGTVRVHISLASESAGDTNGSGVAGHYMKGAEIAKGGMGAVLEANDQLLGRTVAMKVVRHDIGDSESIRLRFIREATVLARLEHPSIVPIYEMGKDAEGRLYYTMKKVEGRTLQAILDDLKAGKAATVKEYTLDRLLNIFRKICEAMSFAHAKGVIHRDLKPENVMVGQFGEVLVMDWGLAKVLYDVAQTAQEMQLLASANGAEANPKDSTLPTGFEELSDSQMRGSSQNLTVDGAVMGSPQYMPPEQAEGKVGDLDERADVFSLGGVLYAILTLKPPVEGRTVKEVLDKVKSGNIVPPTHFNIGSSSANGKKLPAGTVNDPKQITPLPHCPGGRVPGALSSVTMKALAFDREQRYGSVGELLADVEAYQRGFATSAENVNLLGQLGLLMKRHKGIAISSGAAVVLITVLSIGFMIKVRAERNAALKAEQEAVKQAELARTAESEALAGREVTRRALGKSAISLAEASFREANGPAMQAALNDVPADLRDPTWSYLLTQADSSFARINTGGGDILAVAADPTRPGVFAVMDQKHKVTILNVRNGRRYAEFEPGFSNRVNGVVYRLAFAPAGGRIAIGRSGPGGVVLHRANDGGKVAELATGPGLCHGLEFGGPNKLLWEGQKQIKVWNPTSGELLWQRKEELGNVGIRAAFVPGGKELVIFTTKDRLQLVKADDGSLVKSLGGRGAGYFFHMAVRPDGLAVVTYADERLTECISLEDGRKLFTLPERTVRNWLGFTASGEQLITLGTMVGGVQSIEVWNAMTGDAIRAVLGGKGEVNGMGIHPLSQELLVGGAESRVWDLTGARPRWKLATTVAGNIAFLGKEDLILSAMNTNDWALRRLSNGRAEMLWEPNPKALYTSGVSPDGGSAAITRSGYSTNITLMRKNGDALEETAVLPVGFWSYRFRFNADGTRLAAMERQENPRLKLFDVPGKKAATTPELRGINRINDLGWVGKERLLGLVTANAKRGNPGSVERIVLWDGTSGKEIATVTSQTTLEALAISPEGKLFAEAGADKTIRIRDAVTLEVKNSFRAHDAGVTVLAWHPTKPWIASGAQDMSVKIVDYEKGRVIREFRGLLYAPIFMTFSPAGSKLAVKTEYDHLIRIWDLEDGAEEMEAPDAAKTLALEKLLSKTEAHQKVSSGLIPDAEGWVNIFAPLTPEVMAMQDSGWALNGDRLSARRQSMFPLPGSFSGTSYEVQLSLQRVRGEDYFLVALPVGNRKVAFVINSQPKNGYVTGLEQVDGKFANVVPGVLKGLFWKNEETQRLQITVKIAGGNASIACALNEKPFYSWSGPIEKLSLAPNKQADPVGAIGIEAGSAGWAVFAAKVKRL